MDRGDEGGGSLRLAEVIDRHGGELVADFRRFYGINLGDILSDDSDLSPGYVLQLIEYLPADSAFVAANLGGREKVWSINDHLLATNIDAVNTLTHVMIAAHSGKKFKPPEPMWRPGSDEKQESKKKSPNLFAATALSMLARAKKAKEARGS